jgi:hypothetical protein
MSSTTTTSLTAKQVHEDIERTLGSRPARPETPAEKLEAALKDGGAAAWCVMKRHPFLSAAAIAFGAIALAAAIGAAELSFGGALAFAAYKVLREGEPPLPALEELEGRLSVE